MREFVEQLKKINEQQEWLKNWEKEQYHDIGEPSSVQKSIFSLMEYKTIWVTRPEPQWPLMTTRWMVYGLDEEHEMIIPHGFYNSEKRANEKAEEFKNNSAMNGFVSKFKVHCVEIDR